jgi:hypothetical protein
MSSYSVFRSRVALFVVCLFGATLAGLGHSRASGLWTETAGNHFSYLPVVLKKLANPWQEVNLGSASGGGISQNASASSQASLAFAANGTAYVAWTDIDSTIAPARWRIYIRRWNGSSWEEVGPGSASGDGISILPQRAAGPSVAVAPDGTPYVAWHTELSGANDEIYVRRWNGSSWEEVGPGSASGGGISNTPHSSGGPSLVITANGVPYVAWGEISTEASYVYIRRWNGVVWEEVGANSASGKGIGQGGASSVTPAAATSPDDTIYVTWVHQSLDGSIPLSIYVKQWNGSQWEEASPGSASGGGISQTDVANSPSIAVDSQDMPYVAWSDTNLSTNNSEIYLRHWNGSSWEEVGPGSASAGGVSQNEGRSLEPSLTIAVDGRVYAAWFDESSGNFEIYVRRWSGSSWEEVGAGSASGGGISQNSAMSDYPALTFSPEGVPHIAWGDGSSGNYDIYIRHYPGN